MPHSPTKFRIGGSQSITLRCDGPFCRVRARLGTVHWSTELHVPEAQVVEFLNAVKSLLETLQGTADFVADGECSLKLHLITNHRGAIRTEYHATGRHGGVAHSRWQVSGAFTCWPNAYLTELSRTD